MKIEIPTPLRIKDADEIIVDGVTYVKKEIGAMQGMLFDVLNSLPVMVTDGFEYE